MFASQFILRIANLVLLIISMNMLWQFIISMRTDLYLIILNHLGVSSLHSASLKKLKNILRKGESEKMTVYNKAYVITWVVWGIFFCYILCIWILGICSVRNEYVKKFGK